MVVSVKLKSLGSKSQTICIGKLPENKLPSLFTCNGDGADVCVLARFVSDGAAQEFEGFIKNLDEALGTSRLSIS